MLPRTCFLFLKVRLCQTKDSFLLFQGLSFPPHSSSWRRCFNSFDTHQLLFSKALCCISFTSQGLTGLSPDVPWSSHVQFSLSPNWTCGDLAQRLRPAPEENEKIPLHPPQLFSYYSWMSYTRELSHTQVWKLRTPRARCPQVWSVSGLCLLFHRCFLCTVSSHGKAGKESFLGLFYKNTNVIHEGSTLRRQLLPKAPPTNTTILGDRISMHETCGRHKRGNHPTFCVVLAMSSPTTCPHC